MSDRPNPIQRCSFCEAPREQVVFLISGLPTVYICDQCVATCVAISEAERLKEDAARRAPAYSDLRCMKCGANVLHEDAAQGLGVCRQHRQQAEDGGAL